MKKYIIGVILYSCSVGLAHAAESNDFTIFTLGGESIGYTEGTNNIATKSKRLNNLIQVSKSYTEINPDFGFYITTTSTLFANSNQETWSISPYGAVQQNTRKISLTDLSVDGAWNVSSGFQLLAGLGWNFANFNRASHSYPQGTRGVYNAATKVFTPNIYGPHQQVTSAAGNSIYIARQPGAVSEDSSTVFVRVGGRYDSFFNSKSDWRYILGAQAETPLYYHVTNSNYPNSEWTSSFKGYNLHVEMGLGYKLNEKFDVITLLSGDYRFRPETSIKADGSRVPRVISTVIRASAGLSWHY